MKKEKFLFICTYCNSKYDKVPYPNCDDCSGYEFKRVKLIDTYEECPPFEGEEQEEEVELEEMPNSDEYSDEEKDLIRKNIEEAVDELSEVLKDRFAMGEYDDYDDGANDTPIYDDDGNDGTGD